MGSYIIIFFRLFFLILLRPTHIDFDLFFFLARTGKYRKFECNEDLK